MPVWRYTEVKINVVSASEKLPHVKMHSSAMNADSGCIALAAQAIHTPRTLKSRDTFVTGFHSSGFCDECKPTATAHDSVQQLNSASELHEEEPEESEDYL